jgi:hypothetical protein
MTVAELEKRLERLEEIVLNKTSPAPQRTAKWWLDQAGTFANDPGYEQVVRLGRKYRKSLKPKLRTAAR